jgi:ribosomal-protein-alanine N-acetyltransferase
MSIQQLFSPPSIFPRLETERLVLRQIKESDADDLFRLYSDAAVMQYRGTDLYHASEEAHSLIKHFQELDQKARGQRWGLSFHGQEERLLGTAGLNKINWVHFRGEIGYELSPACWNRGLMTEALSAITAYTFSAYKLHTIEANIAPANLASERVLQKLGFIKEAHYKENWFYRGWWDSVIYTLHKK